MQLLAKVEKMKIHYFLIVLFILLSFQISKSQGTQGVGVGISSYYVNISGSILDYYVSTIRIVNPSPYEIKVKVSFDCRNCNSDIKIFGLKVGESTLDYRSFFFFDKDDITIKPLSFENDAAAIKIIFSPKFLIKNNVRIFTPEAINFFIKLVNKKYENSFVIPFYTLFLGEKKILGLIVADVYASSFGEMGVTPSVGSNLEISARGMPYSSFVILCLLVLLIGIFIFRKIKGKTKHKKKE